MVCQSPGKTRFRALKYESGDANKPTIVVKVIACFQSMDNCQAEYFRLLLKPVTSLEFNRKSMPLDTKQQDLPLGVNPGDCFENIAARLVHDVPLPEKLYAAELQPPPLQSLLSSHDKESCGKQFVRSWCAATITPHGALESSQKRLLIFDQAGNQTRLLGCPFPLQFPSPEAAKPMDLSSLHGLREDQVTLEEFGENHLNGNESEMHEDTEEINALLYSDDDDWESEDEVMSTGHSPYPIERVCNKRESEESNGPCKKQKVNNFSDLSSSSSSSSLVGTKSSTKLHESNIFTKEDTGSGLSNEQSRKDKISTALKILESIVPGAKGEEALLLVDEAIDYLNLLKRDLEIKNQC